MLDKSIPYYNIIMKAEVFNPKINFHLPDGYNIKYFQEGDEIHWAEIEASVGEFTDVSEAYDYFVKTYSNNINLLCERCLFIVDSENRYAGTCTAWYDQKNNEIVSSVHWLGVKPEFQNKGFGKFLVYNTLKTFNSLNLFPVFLHTQTWSHKAVAIYNTFGFNILKEETFSSYTNDYEKAMATLKRVLDDGIYQQLIKTVK